MWNRHDVITSLLKLLRKYALVTIAYEPLTYVVTLNSKAEDEFLILACDGIWDVMTNEDAYEFVSNQLKVSFAPDRSPRFLCIQSRFPPLNQELFRVSTAGPLLL
jgi:serine/threonine protein phosphatase PrpC